MLQSATPIIVKVLEAPVKGTTIVDVLVGSLGLTTALLLAAALLGSLLGGLLIGIKLVRARFNLEPVPDSESMRVTPHVTTVSSREPRSSSSS